MCIYRKSIFAKALGGNGNMKYGILLKLINNNKNFEEK